MNSNQAGFSKPPKKGSILTNQYGMKSEVLGLYGAGGAETR